MSRIIAKTGFIDEVFLGYKYAMLLKVLSPDWIPGLIQFILQCNLPDGKTANLHYPYPFYYAERRQGRVFEHQHHKYAEP